MTQLTDQSADRRSGADRRRPDRDSERPSRADGSDPIAAWNLTIPPALRDVRCVDPWAQVLQRSILDEHEGNHEDAARAWDEALVWQLNGHDPTGRRAANGAAEVLAFHQALGRLTDWTFSQELISLEGSRGPIVEAHLRTTATRQGRTLDIPTLVVFEMSCLRVRRVTEIPGDIASWDAFWGA